MIKISIKRIVTVNIYPTITNFNDVIIYIHAHPDKTNADGSAQIKGGY